MNKKQSNKKKKADQYNDPKHNYLKYWQGRDYEHAAEEIAINRILKGRSFKNAIDIGGGYGRLSVLLKKYSDKVTLAEPSQQQLDIAKDFLAHHSGVSAMLMQADDLQFADASIDLGIMIRVMHHLPDPSTEFSEISRVLSDDGVFILEVANYAHARNQIRYLLRGKRLPLDPVDIRSEKNKKNKDEIAFVNHNPKTVIKQLAHAGLRVERVFSVSNLRSTLLKKLLPKKVMLAIEKPLQPLLGKLYFGPSTFLVVRKVPK